MTVLGFSLFHPGLLALGAALVAVPVLIHLFTRQRVRRQPWAAMAWLLAAVRRHQRRMRIENWLVLLLRCLAVLLLGLALARPVLEATGLAGLFAGKRSVYVAVDNSYSMEAAREGRSILDLALAEADALLGGIRSDDTVAVLATNDPRTTQSDGRSPFVLVSRSVGTEGATRAKEAVGGLRARHAPARWNETLELLRRQTTTEDVQRVVVLITDLQDADWNEATLASLEAIAALPASIRIVDVGGTQRRNLTVASVKTLMKRDAFAGRPLRLSTTIENHGPRAVEGARVKVFKDGKLTPIRTRKIATLPAFGASPSKPGSETLIFDLPASELQEPGAHVLTVEVSPPPEDPDADGLALDSRRDLSLRLRDRIRVAAWTRASRGAKPTAESYLRGIYDRYGFDEKGRRVDRDNLYELTHSVLTESRLLEALRDPRETLDLVVLANVAPGREGAAALASFVRAGGALLVFVGDHIRDPASLNDRFHADANQRLLPLPYLASDLRDPSTQPPFSLDLESGGDHPLAAPFTGEDARTWIALAPPAIWGRFPFPNRSPDEGAAPPPGTSGPGDPRSPSEAVVLRYAVDHSPFAVEGRLGDGRTLWVSTSLDHGWLDRALPFFLPVFLDEAAVHLTRPDSARLNLEVGRSIVVTWLPRDATDVRLMDPGGGQRTPSRLEARGALERPTWVQDRVGTAGVWHLTYELAGGVRGRPERHDVSFAVNPDPSEGRLHRAEDARILGRFGPNADLAILTSWEHDAGTAEATRRGEISTLLLWIVLGILILEPVLAWAFGRQRKVGARGATR